LYKLYNKNIGLTNYLSPDIRRFGKKILVYYYLELGQAIIGKISYGAKKNLSLSEKKSLSKNIF